MSYSLRACGSFCICSKIMRMAGSLMICCTSGSDMALRFTSSGLSLRVAWLTIQRCRPSVASCRDREIEKYNFVVWSHLHQHNPPKKLRDALVVPSNCRSCIPLSWNRALELSGTHPLLLRSPS